MNIQMSTTIITKKFIDFLKHNNIYDTFMHEAGLSDEYTIFMYINKCRKNKVEDSRFVDYAFSWDDTSNGIKFWSKINDSWYDMLHKIDKDTFNNLKSIW
jgi:hypothetical protein